MDLPGPLLFRNPVGDAEGDQPLPAFWSREHVHQVVVHAVRLQPRQLRLKQPVKVCVFADGIMRQLGGDFYPVAQAVLFEDAAEQRLAAAVGIGRIEVVDTLFDGVADMPLHLVFVLVEAHTAKAQGRNMVAVFRIDTILHNLSFLKIL